jgi:hypothetical protein
MGAGPLAGVAAALALEAGWVVVNEDGVVIIPSPFRALISCRASP